MSCSKRHAFAPSLVIPSRVLADPTALEMALLRSMLDTVQAERAAPLAPKAGQVAFRQLESLVAEDNNTVAAFKPGDTRLLEQLFGRHDVLFEVLAHVRDGDSGRALAGLHEAYDEANPSVREGAPVLHRGVDLDLSHLTAALLAHGQQDAIAAPAVQPLRPRLRRWSRRPSGASLLGQALRSGHARCALSCAGIVAARCSSASLAPSGIELDLASQQDTLDACVRSGSALKLAWPWLNADGETVLRTTIMLSAGIVPRRHTTTPPASAAQRFDVIFQQLRRLVSSDWVEHPALSAGRRVALPAQALHVQVDRPTADEHSASQQQEQHQECEGGRATRISPSVLDHEGKGGEQQSLACAHELATYRPRAGQAEEIRQPTQCAVELEAAHTSSDWPRSAQRTRSSLPGAL